MKTRSKWVDATRSDRCPVCGATHWCGWTTDRRLVRCRHEEADCLRAYKDDAGPVYLHRWPGGDYAPPPRDSAPDSPPAEPANPETRHRVYSELLALLALDDRHREALLSRGLDAGAIERGGYRTLPRSRTRVVRDLRARHGDADLLGVPGFHVKKGKDGGPPYLALAGMSGLVVPCRDLLGKIVALKVRADDPDAPAKYTYLSSNKYNGPKAGSHAHAPAGTPVEAARVRVTEGELKADVLFLRTGEPTVSMPGVGMWRLALEAARGMGAGAVRLAYDADWREKVAVASSILALAAEAEAVGMAVEVEDWDPADGKGLDDVLAAGKRPRLLTGEEVGPWLAGVRRTYAELGGPPETSPVTEDPAPPWTREGADPQAGPEAGATVVLRAKEAVKAGGVDALFGDESLLKAIAAESLARIRVRAFLGSVRGARVRDFDALMELCAPPPPEPGDEPEVEPYVVADGRLCRMQRTKEGPVPVPLCNYDGRIVEEVARDDGVAEPERSIAVEGSLVTGQRMPRKDVPADKFDEMKWAGTEWVAGASPNPGSREHLRRAMVYLAQRGSPDGVIPRRTVYTHTGWREVGGRWVYLHGGGAIGRDGPVPGVCVELPDALARYRLPAPLEGGERRAAVRASLELRTLGPAEVTVPLLAAVYRAAMGRVNHALHLAGPTGCYKSSLSGLMLAHFGAGWRYDAMPGSWDSTASALECLGSAAKDALFVIDDFRPRGGRSEVDRLHSTADRVIRGMANGTGRQRLDWKRREAHGGYAVRGLILSTGEDVPRGESLRARMLILQAEPGTIGPLERLKDRGRAAANGVFAGAVAAYLRWMAGRFEAVTRHAQDAHDCLPPELAGACHGQHARLSGAVASLYAGWDCFLGFALEVGAVGPAEAADLRREGLEALARGAESQAAEVAGENEADRFMALLASAISSGEAHLQGADGNVPMDARRFGWQIQQGYAGESATGRYEPRGPCVGWVDGGDVYLDGEAAYAAAQKMARSQEAGLPVSQRTLWKRLDQRGHLKTKDADRGRLAVRRVLQGQRRVVLHVQWPGTEGADTNDIPA